ncbi:MAG: hypothetical protein H8E94_02985 [Alphaproteobacteria bacterium]|nr:hypothetical protein [Alphaproteobacteria bacterium]
MVTAKDIHVAPIKAQDANRLIKRLHYSGKVVNNSQLHLGVFLDGRLDGAMQFGPSLDKRKMQGLVADTPWNGFIELNRMAFSEALPRNSESRAIAIAIKIIRKNYPHIQWVVSFADGTQCGDGTIYRASGFTLTGINKSMNLVRRCDGGVIHKMTLESNPTSPRDELDGKSYYDITAGKYDLQAYVRAVDGVVIPGYQLRYMYFIDPTARERLTVPILPFSKIDEMGAGMYLGVKREKQAMAGPPAQRRGSADLHAPNSPLVKGGADATV